MAVTKHLLIGSRDDALICHKAQITRHSLLPAWVPVPHQCVEGVASCVVGLGVAIKDAV